MQSDAYQPLNSVAVASYSRNHEQRIGQSQTPSGRNGDVDTTDATKPRFSLCDYPKGGFSRTILYILIAAGIILGGTGQQISLPLYLSTFGHGGGPYFVLWLCSLSFTIIFGVISLILYRFSNNIQKHMLSREWLPYMVLVGLFDAMNGVLIVYSSPLSRVSGPLQAILGQTMLPFTFIATRFLLGRRYTLMQLMGACVVFIGAFWSMIPLFKRAQDHEVDVNPGSWWWPFVYLLGQVPGALMNVVQQKLQDQYKRSSQEKYGNAIPAHAHEYSVFLFQACESLFQWIFMCCFFFFDILPNYGTSENVHDFFTNFQFGFQCMFDTSSTLAVSDRCQYSGGLALLFIFCYTCSYIFGTLGTGHATANFVSCVSCASPVLALVFWYAFPSANAWAQGTPYSLTGMDGAFNITGLLIIFLGAFLFHKFNNENRHKHIVDEETVELCCPPFVNLPAEF